MGQVITISYPADGSLTIEEPAHRQLKIFYTTGPANDTVVARVEQWTAPAESPFNGVKVRTVNYNYTLYSTRSVNYSSLTSVNYPDGTTASYAYQGSNAASESTRPLIRTCIDPMFGGPMWKAAYEFAPTGSNPDGSTVVYGQLKSVKYFDGTTIGSAVSTLTISGAYSRTLTRGDGPQQSFVYWGTNTNNLQPNYALKSVSDFKGWFGPSGNDTNFYYHQPNALDLGLVWWATDHNGNTTTYDDYNWAGNPTKVTYPDGESAPSTGYVYASSTCDDPNNRDPNSPYYLFALTNGKSRSGERGQDAEFYRDTSKRVTNIYYPRKQAVVDDPQRGETESFSYNTLGQILTHRTRNGGTERFVYDSRGLLTEYYDPMHLPTGTSPDSSEITQFSGPSISYQYYPDSANLSTTLPWADRVWKMTDARGNTTEFTYNARGQMISRKSAGAANPVLNSYNPNGTLASVTDELGHATSYAYDDYKRVVTTTLPAPDASGTSSTTSFCYSAGCEPGPTGGGANSYLHTSSQPTLVTSPAGKATKIVYDENFQPTSMTVGYGSSDALTNTFSYDHNGNRLTSTDMTDHSVVYYYDEQNRLVHMDDPMVAASPVPHANSNSHTVSWSYEPASSRLSSVQRANDQTISYSYDDIFPTRLTRIDVQQGPSPLSQTVFTYNSGNNGSVPLGARGLLKTMQDPRGGVYTYAYDLMGRKSSVTYPVDSRKEEWTFDTAGNLLTFKNRNGKTQSFDNYDQRNRLIHFQWDDSVTPAVTLGYDDASRLLTVDNGVALISRDYFNNNTLKSETTTIQGDNVARQVSYSYNVDLTPHTVAYPDGTSFGFAYTGRNQIESILNAQGTPIASYEYDNRGNLTDRALENGTSSTLAYDEMSRITGVTHNFAGADTRTISYGYDEMNNREWVKRNNGGTSVFGDRFRYDLADQVIDTRLDITNPDVAPSPAPTPNITYDANGNRDSFQPYGVTENYSTDLLNRYTGRTGNHPFTAAYDGNSNLTSGYQLSSAYDAQNRLLSATKSGAAETFKYDGLNRLVSPRLARRPRPTMFTAAGV